MVWYVHSLTGYIHYMYNNYSHVIHAIHHSNKILWANHLTMTLHLVWFFYLLLLSVAYWILQFVSSPPLSIAVSTWKDTSCTKIPWTYGGNSQPAHNVAKNNKLQWMFTCQTNIIQTFHIVLKGHKPPASIIVLHLHIWKYYQHNSKMLLCMLTRSLYAHCFGLCNDIIP